MTVLITGFDPFDKDTINPAAEVAKHFNNKIIAGEQIVSEILPVVFDKSIDSLKVAIAKYNPKIIISLGLAPGRANISVERVGINVNDARIPDNESNQPIDTKIFDDAQNAYFSTLPIKAIVKNINANRIPAIISNTAGTFVCNHIAYALGYLTENTDIKAGFIHIPFLPEQATNSLEPSMSLETMIKAVEIAIITTLNTQSDEKITGGTIS